MHCVDISLKLTSDGETNRLFGMLLRGTCPLRAVPLLRLVFSPAVSPLPGQPPRGLTAEGPVSVRLAHVRAAAALACCA